MQRYLLLTGFLLLTALLPAQSPIDVGSGGMQTTALEQGENGASLFASGFDESNVGFLHVYIDTTEDPLEDYLFRGRELSDTIVAMLPPRIGELADGGTFYGTMAIHGIDENLYITRLEGPVRDQIDMFAFRDGKVVHLKTLSFLDCSAADCQQLDSYITDLNLDTNFDLVQIARRVTANNGTADERRSVYYMPRDNRRWQLTEELEVPWEGITFFDGEEQDERR